MRSATTRVSSRGQVVIPAAIRNLLRLAPGAQFIVEVAAGERAIILRASLHQELEKRLEASYRWLEETGDDPVTSLHETRAKEREPGRRRRHA